MLCPSLLHTPLFSQGLSGKHKLCSKKEGIVNRQRRLGGNSSRVFTCLDSDDLPILKDSGKCSRSPSHGIDPRLDMVCGDNDCELDINKNILL